jgi:hypothetical protein
MVAKACFIPRLRYKGLKRKKLRIRRGTNELFPESKFCASLYQKLADMERAAQHDIGFVKRKSLNIYHSVAWEHLKLTGE